MKRSAIVLVESVCVTLLLVGFLLPTAAQESNAVGDSSVVPASAPVDENYRLTEEDVIQLDVWNEPQLSKQQLQITPDGKVNIGFIGEIQAAGMTQKELAEAVSKKLEEAGIVANARVQITLLSIHKPRCRVLGAVNRPGEIIFKEGDTIMDAIAQAGSYQENAWLEKATLTRKDSDKPIPLDLRKLFNYGDLSQNLELKNGDTIFIPPAIYSNQIYVLGYVARPGIYPLKEKTTALAAITLAGGPTERGRLTGTVVVRGAPGNPQRVQCDLAKLINEGDLTQDVVLEPGDVVIVPETRRPRWDVISQLLNTVVNIGYLRRYGIF